MQRILSVYDWQLLPVESRMVVKSDIEENRLVRLRVKSPAPVALYLEQDDLVDPLFLTQVNGFDEIEFHIAGSYKMFATGELWLDTLDGTKADVEAVDPTSFTVIAERQARNPEYELMERKMQENLERRMSALMAAVSHTLEQKDREIELARTIAARPDSSQSGETPVAAPPVASPVPAPTAAAGESNVGS